MAKPKATLNYLAYTGKVRDLEARWLEAIEDPEEYREDMLEALATLNKNDQADEAATLATTWLASEQEKSEPADQLELARELLIRCKDSAELRAEVLSLYQQVYADRPGIEQLIEVSGLAGGKTARRGELRTLEIALNVEPGGFVISRSDEQAARVTEMDPETGTFTVTAPNDLQILDADELALAYDLADDTDFRVLVQLEPDRLNQLLEKDPATVVIGVLQSHDGQVDSDELAHALSPRYIPQDQWRKWWTRAKTALKRCPNVIVEGKARAILTYHAEGQSLEDEILPQWDKAGSSMARLSVIDAYFREAKARKAKIRNRLVKRIYGDLSSRFNLMRKGAPAEAFVEALIIDRITDDHPLPEGAEVPVREMLRETPDVLRLLSETTNPSLFLRAVNHIREDRPEDWQTHYARLLPNAPLEACEPMAEALEENGHHDLLVGAVQQATTDYINHIDAVCWLWRGSKIKGLEPLPPREMLLRLLNHLAELPRKDSTSPVVLRDARLKIRTALSAGKYKRFEQVIAEMDAGLASTVQRTISRLDGLGQVVHSKLLRIILDTHPELIKPIERVDPWIDDETIFCTPGGFQKQQSEIEHLETVKIPENAKAIGEAASHGDLSENSEYKFALEERDLLQARLRKAQNDLSLAHVLTPAEVSVDEVNIGTRVTLQAVDGGDETEVTILGPWESDMQQRIYNYRAPLSQRLRDLVIDETAVIDLGQGEREYRVTAINCAV